MRRLPLAPKGLIQNAAMQLPVMDQEVLGASGGELCSLLLSSSLGKHLSSWFGPADEKIPGKYRKAEVFYFDGGSDGAVAAVCERGDRGSSWWWVPFSPPAGSQHAIMSMSFHNSPACWPEMILALSERLSAIDPHNKGHDHEKIRKCLDRAGVLSSDFSPPSLDSVVQTINSARRGRKSP